MRASGRSVGPRGVTLLLVTAVAGVILAGHGWSGRQSGPTPGALGGQSSSAQVGASGSPDPTSPPGQGSPPAAKAGPLLGSQSYAPYSFLVWPGTPNGAAKSAMAGLSISVRRTGSGISVRAGVSGQPLPAGRSYQGGARVYVVEASLGDEAGNVDYNLGDDGVLVTDAHGRIVQ